MGALLTLYLVGMVQYGYPIPLTLYAFVGMIMLVGLVKKNAIMMVDFALDAAARGQYRPAIGDRGSGADPLPADHDDQHGGASLARFRSRSGWAMAARRASRWGSPWWADCCFSQALTLYITPVLYVYLDRLGSRFSRRKEIAAPAE